MAEPDLDKIVKSLHPDTVNSKVRRKHYNARSDYSTSGKDVVDFSGFRKEIIAYVKHHHKTIFGADLPDDMAYAKALQILNAENPNAQFKDFKSAYNAARDGRLGAVLDDIADGLRGEQENAYAINIIHQIDPFDYEAHKKVASKYIAMAKKIAPDAKFEKPEALAKDYNKLLQTQAEVLKMVAEPAKKYEKMKKAA